MKNFHVLCSHLIYYLCQKYHSQHIWSEKCRSWILKIFFLPFPADYLSSSERSPFYKMRFLCRNFPSWKNSFSDVAFINHSRMFKWSIHPFIKSLFYLRLNLKTKIMINDDLKMHFRAWWMKKIVERETFCLCFSYKYFARLCLRLRQSE